jgi:hypothetical protein
MLSCCPAFLLSCCPAVLLSCFPAFLLFCCSAVLLVYVHCLLPAALSPTGHMRCITVEELIAEKRRRDAQKKKEGQWNTSDYLQVVSQRNSVHS